MTPLGRYVLRNLAARPLPTALVVLTMALVGAVTSGVGAVALNLRGVLARSGRDHRVLVLARNALAEVDSSVALDAQREIAAEPGVRAVSAESLYRVETWRQDRTLELALVRGLDDTGVRLRGAALVEGRWPAPGAEEFVAGEALRERHPELAPGGALAFGRHAFTSVGVFRTGDKHDGELWTSRPALDQELQLKSAVTELLVDAASAGDARALAARVSANPRHALRAVPEDEHYRAQLDGFRPVYLGLVVLLVLVSAGTALAATSVLTVVFGQRVADLSVLLAMGFRRRRVARLLLVETELLALGGGALGTALAALALRGYVAFIALPGAGAIVNFRAAVSPAVAAATLGLMLAIGAVAAAQPMARLGRLDLKDGLRMRV